MIDDTCLLSYLIVYSVVGTKALLLLLGLLVVVVGSVGVRSDILSFNRTRSVSSGTRPALAKLDRIVLGRKAS